MESGTRRRDQRRPAIPATSHHFTLLCTLSSLLPSPEYPVIAPHSPPPTPAAPGNPFSIPIRLTFPTQTESVRYAHGILSLDLDEAVIERDLTYAQRRHQGLERILNAVTELPNRVGDGLLEAMIGVAGEDNVALARQGFVRDQEFGIMPRPTTPPAAAGPAGPSSHIPRSEAPSRTPRRLEELDAPIGAAGRDDVELTVHGFGGDSQMQVVARPRTTTVAHPSTRPSTRPSFPVLRSQASARAARIDREIEILNTNHRAIEHERGRPYLLRRYEDLGRILHGVVWFPERIISDDELEWILELAGEEDEVLAVERFVSDYERLGIVEVGEVSQRVDDRD